MQGIIAGLIINAHYLEHLLFNGTTSRAREQIYADADRLGAYNNASTQRERSVVPRWENSLTSRTIAIVRSTPSSDSSISS